MKYADNTTFWFVFCKSDLLLQRMGDGLYTIPTGDTPPTEVKPWTTIHQIDVPLMDTMHVKAYTIDAPITESATFEMCGLRASYYKLPRVLYLAAVHVGMGAIVLAVHQSGFRRGVEFRLQGLCRQVCDEIG